MSLTLENNGLLTLEDMIEIEGFSKEISSDCIEQWPSNLRLMIRIEGLSKGKGFLLYTTMAL